MNFQAQTFRRDNYFQKKNDNAMIDMYQQFLDGHGEYEDEEEVDAAEIN